MALQRAFDILAIGEPLLEFNQTDPSSPNYLQGFGGDTSNAIIAAARSGARAAYFTRLGDDAFGKAFLDLWQAEGVSSDAVVIDKTAPTGIYFVTHDASGHVFTYRRDGSAASLMQRSEITPELVASARVLHTSGISQAISPNAADAVLHAINLARDAGTLVSYDPNYRPRLWSIERARSVVNEALALADIALPSLEDAVLLNGLTRPDAIVDHYLRMGPRIVALTLGPKGAMIATRVRRETIPAPTAKAVDSTGAGDAFDGAFLAEYLRCQDAVAAGHYAACAAAMATEAFGAVAPIPRRESVMARLKQAIRA